MFWSPSEKPRILAQTKKPEVTQFGKNGAPPEQNLFFNIKIINVHKLIIRKQNGKIWSAEGDPNESLGDENKNVFSYPPLGSSALKFSYNEDNVLLKTLSTT